MPVVNFKVNPFSVSHSHSHRLPSLCQDVPGVRIVFLVAEPVNGDMEDRDEVQERLRGEAETRADILQPSIEDGHRKLGYKILSGKWSEKLFARLICTFNPKFPNNLSFV